MNTQHAQHFTQQLQYSYPQIENIQLLTVDGLSMHSDKHFPDEDKLSALSALLYSSAERLADCVNGDTSKGLIVCIGESAYVIARFGNDLVLGLQVPADLGHPQFLQTVCNFISQHERDLARLH